MKYAIWWLSQEACEQVINADHNLPDYIRNELNSRQGRPGRGRLWVPKSIDLDEITWNDEATMASAASSCGGIVIDAVDISHVMFLPGFVTDTRLEIWRRRGERYKNACI